jgi:uncharacterized protein YndB with AHSA1/START domain
VDVYSVRPVSVSAHIPAPPDQVFTLVSDTRNDPLWCRNVESVDLVEGSKVEVGTRYRFHQHLDRPGAERVQFDVDVEVIELGDRSIKWEARDRFQTRTIKLAVEPEGAGTRITQVTRATFRRPPGMARWLYPLLARRIFTRQFRHLGTYFEESGLSPAE